MKLLTITCVILMASISIASAKSMTRSDIEQNFIGKSLSFVSKKGVTATVRFSKNGKARLSNTNFSIKSDSGTWKFKGNKHCVSWRKVRSGKEKCFTYKTAGTGKFKNQDGTILVIK